MLFRSCMRRNPHEQEDTRTQLYHVGCVGQESHKAKGAALLNMALRPEPAASPAEQADRPAVGTPCGDEVHVPMKCEGVLSAPYLLKDERTSVPGYRCGGNKVPPKKGNGDRLFPLSPRFQC